MEKSEEKCMDRGNLSSWSPLELKVIRGMFKISDWRVPGKRKVYIMKNTFIIRVQNELQSLLQVHRTLDDIQCRLRYELKAQAIKHARQIMVTRFGCTSYPRIQRRIQRMENPNHQRDNVWWLQMYKRAILEPSVDDTNLRAYFAHERALLRIFGEQLRLPASCQCTWNQPPKCSVLQILGISAPESIELYHLIVFVMTFMQDYPKFTLTELCQAFIRQYPEVRALSGIPRILAQLMGAFLRFNSPGKITDGMSL